MKMKNLDNIPVLIGKTDEQIKSFYEEIIPLTLLESYPVYKYAEIFGITQDSKVLNNVRYALFQIKEVNRRKLSTEENNILVANIKRMKTYYTRVNPNNIKIGKSINGIEQIEMVEPTSEQISVALQYLYLKGEYICQTLLLKELRKLLVTKELDYDTIKNNLRKLTTKDQEELDRRIKMIAIEKPIPRVDSIIMNSNQISPLAQKRIAVETILKEHEWDKGVKMDRLQKKHSR